LDFDEQSAPKGAFLKQFASQGVYLEQMGHI
jgi:hypothetical protein